MTADDTPTAGATVTVPVDTETAFGTFTAGLGTWWPPEYSWGPDTLDRHALEPMVGGRVTEFGDRGSQHDWGRVTVWDPPARLELAWLIAPDRTPCPDSPSRVTVTFTADGEDGTVVAVVHDRFDAHGEAGPDYAAALAGDRGWPFILAAYATMLVDGDRATPPDA